MACWKRCAGFIRDAVEAEAEQREAAVTLQAPMPGKAGWSKTGTSWRPSALILSRRLHTKEAIMAMRSAQWEEGRAAKKSGAPYTADPYRAGSQESADWLAGYTYDEREHNVDRPAPREG